MSHRSCCLNAKIAELPGRRIGATAGARGIVVTVDEHPMENAVIGVAHDQLAGTPARSAEVCDPFGVLEGLARERVGLIGARRRTCI
ncbi:MAG TPA: hypothetical protein VMH26_03510 [Burkholderiales bacterium]|nr:hypothetical protein [Burkholderiales bacterium]